MSDVRDTPDPATAIADRVATLATEAGSGRAVEVGIGRRPAVAATLADRGVTVTATDLSRRAVPAGVEFVRDDVTDPRLGVYRGADIVYALNCPPELHRPTFRLARQVDAPFLFTTLGTDPPAVDARPETIPGGTLFLARRRGPHR